MFFYSPSTRSALRPLFLLAFAVVCFGAWEDPRLSAFFEGGYNSNSAQLSECDLTAFEAGDPYWIDLSSTDDAVFRAGFEGEYRLRLSGVRIIGGLGYRFNKYLNNDEMDYHFVRPSMSVLKGSFRGDFALAHIPKYTPTLYSDDDSPQMPKLWSSYSTTRGEADLRYELFGKHSLALAGQVHRDTYSDDFPEYDGWGYRFGPVWRWSGPVYIKLGYAYREFSARGWDSEGETKATSDETDISFAEDRIDAYLSRRVYILSRRGLVGASLALARRFYSSEKDFSLDYIHVGRRDLRADLSPFLSCDVTDKMTITLRYDYTFRSADSPYYDLDSVKSWTRSIISARMAYSIF